MSRMTKTGAVIAALWAAPALAGPGNGIRFGGSEGRLHPYLELEGRYDSNVFLTSTGTAQGDLILHVRPGLRLDVPGDPAKVFFDGQLDWAQYMGSGTPKELSRLYGNATVGVRVNEGGTLSLDAEDAFRRANESPSLSLGAGVVANYNTLRASAPWTPGGGALVLTTSGEWVLESFEPYFKNDPTPFSKLGYNELHAGEELSWRFLPRTSAVFEASFFDRIVNSELTSTGVRGLRLSAGATGLVTPHFAATVKAGYADTFGSAHTPFRTWLTTLEGEWIGNETLGARAGYEHGMGSDPGKQFAVFQLHRVYAEGRLELAAKVAFRLRAEWQQRDYPALEIAPATMSTGGTAEILRVEPTVEAQVARWARLGVGYGYTARSSALSTVVTAQGLDYSKSEVWLRATFTY